MQDFEAPTMTECIKIFLDAKPCHGVNSVPPSHQSLMMKAFGNSHHTDTAYHPEKHSLIQSQRKLEI